MIRRARSIGIAVGAVGLLYTAAVAFMAINETRLIFPPAQPLGVTRSVPSPDAGIPWDSVRIVAPDGVPVFLIVSQLADAARHPWVLYFHGNSGQLGNQGNVERYRLLRDAGFNVMAMEFRGFGASVSAGMPSSATLATDARAAWEYLLATYGPPPSQIAIYGRSLGGGIAAQLAVAVSPAALVTEGAFTSLAQLVADLTPWLPAGIVRLVARNRFDNLGVAPALHMPWLVFHGTADSYIPFAHGEALAAAAHAGRLIPLDTGHEGGVVVDRAVALDALRTLARELRPPQQKPQQNAPGPRQ